MRANEELSKVLGSLCGRTALVERAISLFEENDEEEKKFNA